MKNKFIILAVIVVAVVGLTLLALKNKTKEIIKVPNVVPPTLISTMPTSGKYCYARIQKATDTAPYNVEEHVVLNFDNTKVTGTKRGTQAGPDMTNGYTGTLTGSVISSEPEQEMELTYAYTVEGAKNRELEVYAIRDNKLIKKRWALHDSKINGASILVPDYKGEPTITTYDTETCAK